MPPDTISYMGASGTISVLIPAFNEVRTIEEIIRQVKAVDLPIEIVAVDDGSTDGTREFLRGLAPDTAKVVLHEANKGKGAAVRTALEHATGDIVIIQDADLEYDPGDYASLVEPILEGRADVVYGSRITGPTSSQHSHTTFYLGGRILTIIANVLYRTHITDEPTCYKVFRRDVLERITLTCRRFEFCPEVTAKVARAGIRIHEVPIRYYPRKLDEGKKISWRDGLVAIWTLVRYRFVRRSSFLREAGLDRVAGPVAAPRDHRRAG